MVRQGDGGCEVTAAMLAELAELAYFRVDAERNVVELSPAMERLCGCAAEDVLGRSCLLLHRCEGCLQSCGVFEQGVVRDRTLRLYRADGRPVDVVKSGRVLRDAKGRVSGAIEVLRPAAASEPRAPDDVEGSARVESQESASIRAALVRARYHRAEAARSLGMSRTTLWRKMKEYGL